MFYEQLFKIKSNLYLKINFNKIIIITLLNLLTYIYFVKYI